MNDYVIYGKTGCLDCIEVKKYLTEEGKRYDYTDCDKLLKIDREGFIKVMKEKTGRDTIRFPLVFFNTKYIGGFNETILKVESE
tara:strand:- start:4074 stop:4325 length:252 start_codon:yes stop_codon:yes gene_type:complete